MDAIEGELDPKLERSFRGHKGAVHSVSFHPSGQQLASGSSDKIVMVWNFKPQLRAFKFVGHKVKSFQCSMHNQQANATNPTGCSHVCPIFTLRQINSLWIKRLLCSHMDSECKWRFAHNQITYWHISRCFI